MMRKPKSEILKIKNEINSAREVDTTILFFVPSDRSFPCVVLVCRNGAYVLFIFTG